MQRLSHPQFRALVATCLVSSSIATQDLSSPLSKEQNHVLQLISAGANVFITGSAGTGKTFLLRKAVEYMHRLHPTRNAVGVCAMTGRAAYELGGTTLHDFCGIGIADGSKDDLINEIRKRPDAQARVMQSQAWFIDEVSLMSASLFEALKAAVEQLRHSTAPFGGIQLILAGDFFQLPPISKGRALAKYAFQAAHWPQCVHHVCVLSEVFRQSDPELVHLLHQLRCGVSSPHLVRELQKLARPLNCADGVEPVHLFPLRADVDAMNADYLDRIDLPVRSFHAVDGGTRSPTERAWLLRGLQAPSQLHLKVGAQVMLLRNVSFERDLVNGSLGIVRAFLTAAQWLLSEGYSQQPRYQDYPSGGPSSNNTPADLIYPLVEFRFGRSSRAPELLLLQPCTWSFRIEDEVIAFRTQIPLSLAWAFTVHKAQGATLPKVTVDLFKGFGKGLAYSAITRCTTLDGLQILNATLDQFVPHPAVAEWSRSTIKPRPEVRRMPFTLGDALTNAT